MIKSELVSLIAARNPHLYHADAEKIVDAVLDEITDTLAQCGRVELRGFGVFSVRNRPSRSARNPKTGTSLFVEEKWVPFFRSSREINNLLNSPETDTGVHTNRGQAFREW